MRPIGFELGQRGTRNQHESRVAIVQHRQIAQGVYITRAAWAALVPCRVEHEVIDDELPTALEERLETLFAIRAVEGIVLFDLHHGKPASLGIYAIAVLSELFFMRHEFLPLDEPLTSRNDSGCGIVVVTLAFLFDPVTEVMTANHQPQRDGG